MTGIEAKVVGTQPISGQKPGTSGLRKKVVWEALLTLRTQDYRK